MFKLFSWLSLVLSIVLWMISALLNNNTLLFCSFHIMWISNLLYTMASLQRRFIFGVFNLTFFLFVMGRMTISFIFYKDFGLDYRFDIISKVFSIIMLALVSIRIFYSLFEKRYVVKRSIKRKTTDNYFDVSLLQKACIYLYWITFIFSVIYVLERVLYVQATSYTSYYTSFKTSLPSMFAKFYTMNEIFFFIYLATNPRKKGFLVLGLSFLAIGALSLGYGQRNPIALRFCILVLTYIPLRELFRKQNEEKWVTKKYRFWLLVSVPLAIIFFTFWGSFRVADNQNFSFSIGEAFLSFFDSQGNSARILAETVLNINSFPENRIYTLGPIVEFLQNNIFYKALFGSATYYDGFTVEGAIEGWNFADVISYLYSPFHYLNGVGLGSTYLAETFEDFGYTGIIVISAIYMAIISYIVKNYKKNYFISGIVLILIYDIIYAPRDSALSFMGRIFSITFLTSIVCVYLTYKYLESRRIKVGVSK